MKYFGRDLKNLRYRRWSFYHTLDVLLTVAVLTVVALYVAKHLK